MPALEGSVHWGIYYGKWVSEINFRPNFGVLINFNLSFFSNKQHVCVVSDNETDWATNELEEQESVAGLLLISWATEAQKSIDQRVMIMHTVQLVGVRVKFG